MKNLSRQFQSWRERRRHKRLELWGQTRAKGKMRFVVRGSLIWGGTFIVAFALADLYDDHTVHFYKLLGTMVYVSLVGPIITHVIWWDNEGKYTTAKIEARMKSITKQ